MAQKQEDWDSYAMKRKQAKEEGEEPLKAAKQKQGENNEGRAVNQKHEEEEEEEEEEGEGIQMQGEAEREAQTAPVKQNHGEEEEEWTTSKEGKGMAKESKDKEKQEEKAMTVRLKSSDGYIFEVEWEVAQQSDVVKWFELDPEETAEGGPLFPLENVTGDVLALVIDFCRFHVSPDKILSSQAPKSAPPDGPLLPHEYRTTTCAEYNRQQRITDQETKFLQCLDLNTIVDLLEVASYLNIRVLLDATCNYLAQHLQKSSLDEIRVMAGITKDLTEEEGAAIRANSAWAFPNCLDS